MNQLYTAIGEVEVIMERVPDTENGWEVYTVADGERSSVRYENHFERAYTEYKHQVDTELYSALIDCDEGNPERS